MRRGFRATAAALSAVLVLASCSGVGQPDPGQGRGSGTAGVEGVETFRIGTSSVPGTVNPLMGHEAEGLTWFYDGLVRLRGDQLEPALATSMPQPNADATQWTVTLRPDITFSDGSTLEPADVVATYERALDPAAASPWASELAGLLDITATSDDTVQFTLEAPNAFFGDRLTVGIIPSELAAAEQGTPLTESSLNEKTVGTGAYVLESWAERHDLVLRARPDWWGGEPSIQRIILTAVPNDALRAQMVIDGALDGTMIGPGQAHRLLPEGRSHGALPDNGDVVVLVNETADTRAIALPMANPLTREPLVRRALNFAVDRQALIDGVLHGYANAADNPFPPSVGGNAQPAIFDHDPEQADRLLDQAGWPRGEDGIRTRNGHRAMLTLMHPTDDAERRDQAHVIADQLRAVGIEVSVEGLSWDLIEARMSADALVFAGGTAGNPDATAWSWMACGLAGDGFNNPGHYCNEDFDQALVEGRSTTDLATQQAAYARANRIYAEDPGFVFLNTVSRTYLVRPGQWDGIEPHLEGHVHAVSWGPWWNIAEWTR